MPDLNMEKLQAASRSKFGLDAQGGVQLATGIKRDLNGIIRQLYGSDSGTANAPDDIIELVSDSTWLGGPTVLGRYDWTPANFTRRLLTDAGGAATTLSVDASGRLLAQTAGGTATPHSSNLREFWTLNGLTGENFEAFTIIDPPNWGVNIGSGVVAQQQGLALRYVESGGTHKGVSINNGVVFGTAHINMGVWQSTTAGASFVNRQGGFPSFSNPPFPYGFKVRLIGNIVEAWQFPLNGSVPDSSDTANYRRINLDTEAGDAGLSPTPTGVGGAGILVAHGGTDPQAVMRFQNTWIRVLD